MRGAGDSDRTLDYSFEDKSPRPGQNYYRLRQVDFDGQYDYSPIASVVFDKAGGLSASPNPSGAGGTTLSIRWPQEQPEGTLSLYALDGRRLYQWTLAAGQLEQVVNAPSLPAGVYLARLRDREGREIDVIKLWVLGE